MSVAERAVMIQDAKKFRCRPDLGVQALALCCAILAPVSPQAQTLTQALAEAYNTNPQLLGQRALLRHSGIPSSMHCRIQS
jgi:hypothetical protein